MIQLFIMSNSRFKLYDNSRQRHSPMASGETCGDAVPAELQVVQVREEADRCQAGLGWARDTGVHQPVPRLELSWRGDEDKQRGQ